MQTKHRLILFLLLSFFMLNASFSIVAQAASLSDNGNGTVTDNSTGLVWQQGEAKYAETWQNALSYCNGLSLAGAYDWRLPNVKELESLTDDTRHSPALDTTYFPNTASFQFWSSTTYADCTGSAWDVYFSYGYVGNGNKDNFIYVWPVRGGQVWLFDSLAISGFGDFGTILTGQTATAREVKISNVAADGSKTFTIALAGIDMDEFLLAPGGSVPCVGLSPTLAAGTSCTLLLTPLPLSSGIKTVNLRLTTAVGTATSPFNFQAAAVSGIGGTVIDHSTGNGLAGATVTFVVSYDLSLYTTRANLNCNRTRMTRIKRIYADFII